MVIDEYLIDKFRLEQNSHHLADDITDASYFFFIKVSIFYLIVARAQDILIQLMAWWYTVDKPSHDIKYTMIYDSIWHHNATMG